ncbi:exo-alpha-sialidase [Pseudotabrizicola sp.]|uniref:sialidase family protein n=1 Tax=Pseudotabrizicola sp. TaxID=2939647 RepID=UPI0027238931|nr:exo-alpha-sialidase [Pseudotabrizicola sp.]MDO8883480.1 exo-alpha-sialidase [Pseudotabrizicola sp.]
MPTFPDRELTSAEVAAAMDGRLRAHATTDRKDAFLPSPAIQNHAANLHFLPDGSLACVWFGGTMEGMGDISVWMATLAPDSDCWSPARQLSDDSARSEQNPLLFTAPDGRVWLFHTSQPGGRQDECEIVARISDNGGHNFGPARRIGDFRGIFVRQPALIGPDGEWLLPGFRCVTPQTGRWTGDHDLAVMLISFDAGKTWVARDVPDSLGAVHMNPVAAQNGTIPAFYRDRFARTVRRSVSVDGGLTWSAPSATDLPNNNSSVQAIRLQDGRIAIVMNPVNAAMSADRRLSLYDELDDDTPETEPQASAGAIWGVSRAPMTLAISTDNGLTFPQRHHIDTGTGLALSNNSKDGINRELSYPSILQDAKGGLHIAYTYHRRAIRYVRLAQPPQVSGVAG